MDYTQMQQTFVTHLMDLERAELEASNQRLAASRAKEDTKRKRDESIIRNSFTFLAGN